MENETHKFLLERKAKLEAELAMINAGLQAAGISASSAQPVVRRRSLYAEEPKSIPDQILAVLTAHPNGLSREEVMNKVNEKYNRDISLISCSSYLSTLKTEGRAKFNDDYIWTAK